MARDKETKPSRTDTLADPAMSEAVIGKWSRLSAHARNFLAKASGREPLATNLRKARENRGLSQAAVAKKLRLSRSLVAQIELANRPVTADELAKFAELYGTPAVDLTQTRVATDDPVTVTLLNLAPALIKEFDMQSRIHTVLGTLMATSHLTVLLDRPARRRPAAYSVSPPRTLADAIAQGEQIAKEERQRLGSGDAPVSAIADLCGGQGVPVFAVEMPNDLSAAFVTDASIGSAIAVNAGHDDIRQRFAIAHGYAHAVFEHEATRVCMRQNANELIERRADAFASAFLLPASGVEATVRGLGKGQGSRQVQWVFDATTERSMRTEERSTPGSQAVSYLDVAWVARRFGVAYRLTLSRLLAQGLISEADSTRLLKPKLVELAGEWLNLFSSRAVTSRPGHAVMALSDMNAEHAHMAVEAYRRGLITDSELAQEARTLSLKAPQFSETKLLEFAEAAQ